jgi:hypothetical protein
MAYEIPGFSFSPIAGESVVTAQYKFAKLSGDNTVSIATELTDLPCGIIQNDVAINGAVDVMVSGISKLLVGAGGAVTAGQLIGCDGEGCAIVVDPDGATDYYYVGQVIEGAAASTYCTVLFNCANPVIASGS